MNYANEYNAYWLRSDRAGESSGDLQRTADEILLSCRGGSILDVGSGEGALVRALLDRGADAIGVDVSEVVVSRCNQLAPGRFIHGSILSLPFEADTFDTVVSTDCMEHLAPADVPNALCEIHRVARRNVFLKIATTQDRDNHWHLTVEGRDWWEARCFEAGFRKHPAYYKINDYESLNEDGWQLCILLEKLPPAAARTYPLASLNEERGLHMDMLRDGGERSDAHVIRYQWACGYIKPGDRVLDAACGLGYGGRVIRHNTRASRVVGVDGSEYAINYATESFPDKLGRVDYQLGMLPEALSSFDDNAFDAIVSFETLEHVADPQAVLREFHRLLAPGGRILVSVPNDWSDESGEDPNPYHLHVYDWRRLKHELAEKFTLEEAFAQTASQCKVSNKGNVWERRQRQLRKVEFHDDAPMDCEWWLMVAMKSPIGPAVEYTERVFANIANTSHPSIRYGEYFAYPWLMHAMVNVTYRLRNKEALAGLATEVLEVSLKGSNDYLAALCVTGYCTLEQHGGEAYGAEEVIGLVDNALELASADLMGFRWKISLLFVKGRLLQSVGGLANAKLTYMECAGHDVRTFGVHLATKTTEACFIAGKIAHSLGDPDGARLCWQRAIEIGGQLLDVSMDDILINRSHPNLFNHGDGVREYAVSWDNIGRCANGLSLLAAGSDVDESLLQGSFQTEYATVTRDLVACREQLVFANDRLVDERAVLRARTEYLERSNETLKERTHELVSARSELVNRTRLLEQSSSELVMRTEELVQTRDDLIERTKLAGDRSGELEERTGLLDQVNSQLVERTGLLELANNEISRLHAELGVLRLLVARRTGGLEQACAQLIERTELLEQASEQVENVTQELVEVRKVVVERTELLEHVSSELVERTELLGQASKEVENVTQELVEVRKVVVERTDMLEHANRELAACTLELSEARQVLEEKGRLLELANSEVIRISQSPLKRIWRRMRGGQH